jgi:hypothetical protein
MTNCLCCARQCTNLRESAETNCHYMSKSLSSIELSTKVQTVFKEDSPNWMQLDDTRQSRYNENCFIGKDLHSSEISKQIQEMRTGGSHHLVFQNLAPSYHLGTETLSVLVLMIGDANILLPRELDTFFVPVCS